MLLKVTVPVSPRVAHGHGHIQLPTGEAWAAAELGAEVVTCLIFMIPREMLLLGTGSAPRVTAGKGCTPKELGQASCMLIYSWASFGKEQAWNSRISRRVTIPASCPLGETDSESSFDFFFFLIFYVINCPLEHQEIDKAERSWLISSLAGEQRWRQSFVSKAPVVLSPEELKKHLGTSSLISDSSLSCSKMFKKTYTP